MQSASRRLKPKGRSSRDKVRAHRARLRAMGLRPVQIWIPDTRSKRFVAAAHRQSLALARSEAGAEDQTFIEAVTDRWPG
jgi:hypothetical protein